MILQCTGLQGSEIQDKTLTMVDGDDKPCKHACNVTGGRSILGVCHETHQELLYYNRSTFGVLKL